MQRNPSRALAERMQFIASAMLIIFPVAWIVWFYPYDDLLDRSGTPLGADYAMFYVAGQMVADGDADRLYDQSAHQQRLHALFPGIDSQFCLPYRYPPFVALLAAPLSWLPYGVSYAAFLTVSVAAWCLAWWLLTRELNLLRGWAGRSILIAGAGWPVVLETLIGGQASLLAVLIASATVVCWRHQKWVLAGAVLALSCYKPNVLALFGFACLIYQPRLLRGAIPVLLGLTALSLVTVGPSGLMQYGALGSHLAGGTWQVATPLWKIQGLAGWFGHFVPGYEKALAVMLGLLLVVGIVFRWRRVGIDQRPIQFLVLGLLLTVNSLFNAYTPIYDLSLIALAVLLTAEGLTQLSPQILQTARGQSLVYIVLATVYFGPHLSQAVAKQTGYQFFAVALAAIGLWQARSIWSQDSPLAPATAALGGVGR